MDQKRLFDITQQEEIYPEGNKINPKDRGMPIRTGLRASKRSLRNLGQGDLYTPGRTNVSKPLINTKALRYNPAGPGDYNIPSSFGELPPVRGQSVDPRTKAFKNKESNVLKKNPSFSMAARINNNQVIKSHMQKFIGIETPGVGTYDPLKETLEDKKKLKVLKRLNMYNVVKLAKTGPGSVQQSRTGTVDPEKLQEHASQLVRQIHARNESSSLQPLSVGDIPKMRHLSPNAAASTRNQELNDMIGFADPNADKSFGTQKRFFKPAQDFESANVPCQYVSNFTSLVKSNFSTRGMGNYNAASKTSINSRVTPASISPTRHQKEFEYQQLLGKSGRPIFAKDKDKHETPAPAYYRPEVFEAYHSKTRFNESRKSMPKQERFQETAHFRFANDHAIGEPSRANKQVCYAELEKRRDPGPGYYEDNKIKIEKKQVLHSIPSQDRNLLINPKKAISPIPGPQSYDLTTGLSMCSSTQKIVTNEAYTPAKVRQISPQNSIQEFVDREQIRVAGNASATRSKKAVNNDLVKKASTMNSTARSRSNSNLRKFASVNPKMTLAPKMKMGVFGQAKRNTEFNNEFV